MQSKFYCMKQILQLTRAILFVAFISTLGLTCVKTGVPTTIPFGVLDNLAICGVPLTVTDTGSQIFGPPPQVAGSARDQVLFATNNISNENVSIYNALFGTWTSHLLSPGRNNMGVGSVDNKIFFAGGGGPTIGYPFPIDATDLNAVKIPLDFSNLTSQIDIYNTVNNTWSVAQLPVPSAKVAAASAGHVIIFLEPVESGGNLMEPRVDIYDDASNIWSQANIGVGVGETGAGAGNKIVFAGGLNGSKQPVSHLNPGFDIYDVVSKTWTVGFFPDYLSRARTEMGAAGTCNTIVFAGGATIDGQPSDLVDIYNTVTDSWTTAHLSKPRGVGVFAAALGNKIFIGGGDNTELFGMTTLDIYDTESGTWSTMPITGAQLAAAGAVNKMVVGGAGGKPI